MDLLDILTIVSVLIILIFIILYFNKKKYLDVDPYGKQSFLLTSEGLSSVEFRQKLINDVDQKHPNEKYVFIRASEFGQGTCTTIKNALDKGFKVTSISGPRVWSDTKQCIKNYMRDYPESFEYYILKERPRHQFTIIGNNIIIKVPHEYADKTRTSLGIIDAHPTLLTEFKFYFNKSLIEAKKVNIEEIEKLIEY